MRGAWLAVLFVCTALSGCLSDGGTEPEPASADPAPTVITDPRNLTYVDNASFATGGHVHDYWNGATELLILSESIPTGALFLANRSLAAFLPTDEVVIPSGAGEVEVRMHWDELIPSSYDAQLWVKTQADAAPVFVATIESGDVVRFNVTENQTDLPHQLLSAWEFHWVVQPHPRAMFGETWYQGTVTAEVSAFRSDRTLPVYPAHPDHWGDSSELNVLEASHDFGAISRPVGLCFGGRCEFDAHVAIDGAIVPPDASEVVVTLTEDQPMPGTRLGLRYHPADTRTYSFPAPAIDTGTQRTYQILVEGDGDGDGPYARQTMWDFRVFIDDASTVGSYYSGAYSLHVVAVR